MNTKSGGGLLQFSHFTDEEYLKHLHTKSGPTDEDNESALRIEMLLETYRSLLEKIHTMSCDERDVKASLLRIRNLTAPATEARVARLN